LTLDFFGLRLELLSAKAAYASDLGVLLVADLHLGKDASFRARGAPLPTGPSEGTLNRLTETICTTGCRQVIFVGDLFHGKESNHESERQAFAQFAAHHEGVRLTLVEGNHDRWVDLSGFPAEAVRELSLSDIALVHDPAHCVGPSIAGHLHPGYYLSASRRFGHMLPCFWQSGQCLVLPAFGEFTGLYRIEPERGDRVFLIAGRSVCEAPL
jgi:DNA ligase-associated metallophosphoesterase